MFYLFKKGWRLSAYTNLPIGEKKATRSMARIAMREKADEIKSIERMVDSG